MSRPDWYPDPTNHEQLRWWDGENWTNRVTSVEKSLVYAETDYRRHGQIRSADHSFTIETTRTRTSDKLNEAEVKPEPLQKASQEGVGDSLIDTSDGSNRLKKAGTATLKWLRSDRNLSAKRRIILVSALILSIIITGTILYTTYQIENNFGKPTNHELVEMKDGARNSPNVIDARVTYDEMRWCEDMASCEPYRITASGSTSFNNDDLLSLVRTVALLKKSKADLQLCLSDDELKPELQKDPQYYAALLDTSPAVEGDVEISGSTVCTVLTAEYLKELADSY